MSILIIILLFAVIVAVTVGLTAWFIFRFRRSNRAKKVNDTTVQSEKLPFRWQYIMLPLIALVISVVLAAYFFPKLPDEVALQLKFDASGSKWLSRELAVALMVGPQTLLLLLGTGIVLLVTRFGLLSRQNWTSKISRERVLWLMGNITAVPQGALCFTMFGIFYYNTYQTQLMPVWLFLIITLGISGILLVIFLFFTFWGIKRQPDIHTQETRNI